jgi:NADH dehydrogenase
MRYEVGRLVKGHQIAQKLTSTPANCYCLGKIERYTLVSAEINVVTGAFGYTGSYIARRLLDMEREVRTLTGHPDRPNEFGDQVRAYPYNFDNPSELRKSLEGATTLYNTYWVRFSYGGTTYEQAVENLKTLIRAAEDAGVRRIVHISITNPSIVSPLPYYKGKAETEEFIEHSKLTYGILRPNVIFGDQGILINNIAWFLRRFPVFAVPGDGEYRIQPIYVEDLADLAVALGQREDNVITDAVGPEIYTFNDLLKLIARAVGSRSRIVHVPPVLAFLLAGAVGRVVGDVVLTKEEVKGLLANLLVSSQKPTGTTKLSEWLKKNAEWIGTEYMSEVKKHFK